MTVTAASHDLLADHVISVAASHSKTELGAACHVAVDALLGAPAMGLYLREAHGPALLYSHNAPRGFLEEYAGELAMRDPMIERIMETGCSVIGTSLRRTQGRNIRLMQDLLNRWGFCDNLCGPLYVGAELIGFLYAADRVAPREEPALRAERLDYICRSASLALWRLAADPAPPANVSATPSLAMIMPPRLAEVAHLVCEGRTNKEIARLLGISPHTVKEYISNLCQRLSVRNRTSIAAALLRLQKQEPGVTRSAQEAALLNATFRPRSADLRRCAEYF
ncbi:LuxR C-terminal-related transcriptional regulator [Paracoccus sp. (in: a-proteobacteria)]|uniref:helix-turn-helix transcriptional regulator n=1 Tax=Paracoccus sp. TaxID=267 RepID=UPI003A8426C0